MLIASSIGRKIEPEITTHTGRRYYVTGVTGNNSVAITRAVRLLQDRVFITIETPVDSFVHNARLDVVSGFARSLVWIEPGDTVQAVLAVAGSKAIFEALSVVGRRHEVRIANGAGGLRGVLQTVVDAARFARIGSAEVIGILAASADVADVDAAVWYDDGAFNAVTVAIIIVGWIT